MTAFRSAVAVATVPRPQALRASVAGGFSPSNDGRLFFYAPRALVSGGMPVSSMVLGASAEHLCFINLAAAGSGYRRTITSHLLHEGAIHRCIADQSRSLPSRNLRCPLSSMVAKLTSISHPLRCQYADDYSQKRSGETPCPTEIASEGA
jgi:hypothetical protein